MMRSLRLALSVAAVAATAVLAQNAAVQYEIPNTARQISLPDDKGAAASKNNVLLFAGTYSRDEGWVNGTGKGVHVFQFNTDDGSLTPVGAKAFGFNPTFVSGLNKRGKRVIYAVNEVSDPSVVKNGTVTGWVYAISYDAAGTLTELNRQESGGGSAAHVSVSPDENYVTVANYNGGSVSIYPVKPDGSLGAATDFHQYEKVARDAPHMHSVTWIGKGSTGAFGADLGSDRVAQYNLDAKTGKLTPNAKTPFIERPYNSGPRHIAIHPSKKYAYVLGELSNTIGVYTVKSSTGTLSLNATQQVSTLPADFKNQSSSAEIKTSECGKFLYSSNRGHDSIAIFKIGSNGQLTALGHEPTRGQVPRNFHIYKNFLIVANQNSNNIQVFKINQSSGLLTYTGKSAECGTPVSLFIPRNQ